MAIMAGICMPRGELQASPLESIMVTLSIMLDLSASASTEDGATMSIRNRNAPVDVIRLIPTPPEFVFVCRVTPFHTA
jgi:hypothetical protein